MFNEDEDEHEYGYECMRKYYNDSIQNKIKALKDNEPHKYELEPNVRRMRSPASPFTDRSYCLYSPTRSNEERPESKPKFNVIDLSNIQLWLVFPFPTYNECYYRIRRHAIPSGTYLKYPYAYDPIAKPLSCIVYIVYLVHNGSQE